MAQFCFFFQAEDGIRDLTVTGVQTCALPIYLGGDRDLELRRALADEHASEAEALIAKVMRKDRASEEQDRAVAIRAVSRSEERRVGKECRSRWAGYL